MRSLPHVLAPLALPLLAACATTHTPPEVPPDVDPAHLHFTAAAVSEGDPAPDFTLRTDDGRGQVTLSQWRGRPVVLIFGSTT